MSMELPKVLVVDDNDDNTLVFNALLNNQCHIDSVTNGIDAIDMMKTGNYDLVLMDIRMPGMDGNTAIKHFRAWEKSTQKNKRTPIAVVSALAFAQDKQNSYDSGCDIFLTKPIERKLLLETIHKLVPIV